MKRKLFPIIVLMVTVSTVCLAQVPPIPDMELSSDARSLQIRNTTDEPYLVVNITVSWPAKKETWTQYPDGAVLKKQAITILPYASFVDHYDAGKEMGFPDAVAFMLLTKKDKYVSVNFKLDAKKGYVPDEGLNIDLTTLYQNLPPPKK